MVELIEIFGTEYAITGFQVGLAAVVVGWGLRLIMGPERRPLPIAGMLIAAATVTALTLLDERPDGLVVPLLVLFIGVAASRAVTGAAWLSPLLALPGTLMLAFGGAIAGPTWAQVLAIVVIPVSGLLISDFELRHEGRGLGIIYYSVAALGVLFAVPDTEWPRLFFAAVVMVAFLAWPRVAATLGREGGYVAVAVLFVIAAEGGAARPPSIIGAVACLGMLLIEPPLIYFNPRAVKLIGLVPRAPYGVLVATLPQLLVVFFSSRIAAHSGTEAVAIVIVLVTFAAVVGAGWAMTRVSEIDLSN